MPEAAVDVLQEIADDTIDYFCDKVLKSDWPNSIHVYYFVKTISRWRTKKPDLRASLLCVENDIEDGTFVGILYSKLGGCSIIVYTQEKSCKRLSRALLTTNRIKWSSNPLFEAVLQKHTRVVHNALAARGVTTKVYSHSSILYMDKEDASKLNISCSDDVYVAPLKLSHVPYIHSVWAHNDIYTVGELEDTVRLNSGIGVFSASDDTLLAWVMHTHYGGVGVLQTSNTQLRRGYATLVTRCITRAMGHLGISPHACVMNSNAKSQNLFKSIGYSRVSDIQYICASLPSLDR